MNPPALFLIPTPLFFKSEHAPLLTDFLLPQHHLELQNLRHFVVENAKTARKHLKGISRFPLQELHLEELNEHTPKEKIPDFLNPILQGESVGLMSEAGVPAVADPGAELVFWAHAKNILVRPWIGASSILLALMGSGLNGQAFRFLGYLPAEKNLRAQKIKEIEKISQKNHETQIFIETPYRNLALFCDLIQLCAPQTKISLAVDLTQPTEWIKTQNVKAWQNAALPDLNHHLAVFLLLG